MKGKILEINSTGSWEGQHGVMYTYMVKLQTMNDLTFEGVANAKSETIEGLPYKIGDEVEFEHTESGNEYPDKLKIKKEGYQGGGNEKDKVRGVAMSYAKDLVVSGKIELKNMYDVASDIVKWLDS